MTCTEQNYLHLGHSTDVTVDWEDQTAEIRSTKFNNFWTVYKPRDQTAFFRIKVHTGALHSNLDGHWNGLQKAIDAVVKHCIDQPESQTAKNIRLDKDRKERNAAKTNPKGGELL